MEEVEPFPPYPFPSLPLPLSAKGLPSSVSTLGFFVRYDFCSVLAGAPLSRSQAFLRY